MTPPVAARVAALALALALAAACSDDPTLEPLPNQPLPSGSSTAAAGPTSVLASGTPFADEPDEAAPAGCPARYPAGPGGAPRVPEPPTTQVDGRLVPDADPADALVCRYGPVTAEGSALVGEAPLRGGLERIRTELDLPLGPVRVDCAGGQQVPHLLRLSYADGDLWLAAVQDPASCGGSGNGAATTPAHLGSRLAEAYDAGAWPLS